MYKDCERYKVFWECWKRCANDIIDHNRYLKAVGFFINDLESADSNCKKLTREELFQIMDADKNLIACRAKDIHNLLRI